MSLTYFKRYQMEIDLVAWHCRLPPVPVGYRLLAWNKSLLEMHAEAKYLSFRNEIDANVFPCFGDPTGCRRLMWSISQKQGFLPGATWLIVFYDAETNRFEPCGTIQGIRDQKGMGAVQNLGVTSEHRHRGLGTLLLCRAIDGFCRAGLKRAKLEVTAENADAIRLYQQLGFAEAKTVYKATEAVLS